MEEREAIALLKRGDIGGLEALVRTYQVRAIRASYLVCADASLAEDIVQSAFLHAYERIEQFDAARPFGPWFMRMVVNDTLMALRRQRRISLESASLEDGSLLEFALSQHMDPGVESRLEEAETREEMRAALDRLRPEERAVVIMRYYLDLNDREISSRLNCAPGTVRWRLHNARERLRDLLPEMLRFKTELLRTDD